RDRNVTGVQTCALPIFNLLDLRLPTHYGPFSTMFNSRDKYHSHLRSIHLFKGNPIQLLRNPHPTTFRPRTYPAHQRCVLEILSRSEERRVGKESRSRIQ